MPTITQLTPTHCTGSVSAQALIHRVAHSRYDPASECEHTDDLYQVIVSNEIIAEERHRRSPATRSYTQPQARALLECAGFADILLYSGFSFMPVTADDELFTVADTLPRRS